MKLYYLISIEHAREALETGLEPKTLGFNSLRAAESEWTNESNDYQNEGGFNGPLFFIAVASIPSRYVVKSSSYDSTLFYSLLRVPPSKLRFLDDVKPYEEVEDI